MFLVYGGRSVHSAAEELGLGLNVAYRLAREKQFSIRSKDTISGPGAERVESLWKQGVKPAEFSRRLSIGTSVVYRIGIELALWQRNPHGRRANATPGRCEYLMLRVHAMS